MAKKKAALKKPAARSAARAKISTFPMPALAKGEIYAGVLLNEDGTPKHHVVLLAAKSEPMPWPEAVEWAKKQGGELPTRREQSLLMANAKQHIEGRWHWSSEQRAAYSGYAWLQYFDDGTQGCHGKGSRNLARAVRRAPIQ